MQGFWASCLSRFEKELPAQQFNTWIRPLKLDASAAPSGELRLLAPNRFVLQWVKERYAPRIEAMGAEFFSSPIRVSLNLETADAPEPVKASAPAIRAALPPAPRSPHAERSSLIPEFSFDGFVAGKANQLARAAALQVAEHPGTSYNPLFIYGGVGLGKTHLIHAVGNLVLAQHPSARVRYLHAAQYISDVIRAYQQKSFDEFKRYYHSLDLLLIDDIQFFTGKDRTQEEFLRIQCFDRSPQAAHHHLRHLSEGSCRNGRAPQVTLFVGPDCGNRASGAGNAGRNHLKKGRSSVAQALGGSRLLHSQAHPLERTRTGRRAEERHRLFALQRPRHHA